MTKRIPGTPIERLWGRVKKTNSCWLWQGCRDPEGYGRIQVNGRSAYAHRLAWADRNGQIPDGMMLDHQCRTRHCVRPDHLKVVTNKLNSENLGLSKSNRSGFRGVSWYSRDQKWKGQVRHFGRIHFVGTFDSPEEAHEAVVARRNELFLNNPGDRIAWNAA